MIKKQLLFFVLFSLCFLAPVESEAKRKRRFSLRKWSLSFANGYTLGQIKKSTKSALPGEKIRSAYWTEMEGQMHPFFSSLEISRNFGYYEIGAKIQNLGSTFVSPFFKLNFNKNNSKASIIPSLTLGVVPSHLMGSWLRLSLGLSFNSYVSISPFIGAYAWYKINNDGKYEKYNFHFNTGLRINLYY